MTVKMPSSKPCSIRSVMDIRNPSPSEARAIIAVIPITTPRAVRNALSLRYFIFSQAMENILFRLITLHADLFNTLDQTVFQIDDAI